MELHFLSALLFAASASADSLVAGLSYGIRGVRIPCQANLALALVGTAGTALSMLLGRTACLFLPAGLAGVLGGLMIFLMGAFSLLRRRTPASAPEPEAGSPPRLNRQRTLLLGLALTLNNAGLGIGASITGLPLFPTVFCTFLASLCFLALGNRVGCSRLSGLMGQAAEPLADLVMLVLGIWEMFT